MSERKREPTQAEAYAGIFSEQQREVSAAMDMPDREQRQGKTGVWTFVLVTGDGNVLATGEWGTNYEFTPAQWAELPVIGVRGTVLYGTGTGSGE